MLARYIAKYPDELVADMQQFYTLDITERGPSIKRVAILAAQLPRESRIVRAQCAQAEWSDEMYMLSRIEYGMRWLIWSKTADGQKNRNKPEPNMTPVKARELERKALSVDFSGVAQALGLSLPERG